MNEITNWLTSRLSKHEVEPLRNQEDHLVWRIRRSPREAEPVFLKVPTAYVSPDRQEVRRVTEALDREGLDRRVDEAADSEPTGLLLTRETTGREKTFSLQETDPPAVARMPRQPPDPPGPVPR